MWPSGIQNPTSQSRVRVSDQSGSNFSPLVDAFHPSFPASLEEYIAEPYQTCNDNPKNLRPDEEGNCSDCWPCHGNQIGDIDPSRITNDSTTEHSAENECASGPHYSHGVGCGGKVVPGATDPMFGLPSEVSDLILSYLSHAALDAARHTCKDWRRRILSNSWLLSTVLDVSEGKSPPDGSINGRISHRELLKKLDRDGNLSSTYRHADAWRTRFRARSLEFTIPSSSSVLKSPAFVATARLGTQNGIVAFQLQDMSDSTSHCSKNTLVVYRFDSTDIPRYAGTVHDIEGQGALRIISVKEIRRNAEWVVRIEIGETAGFYLLHTREAFAKSDSRFSLKSLESAEEVLRLSADIIATEMFDGAHEPFLMSSQSWNVLARLPPNGGLRHVCFSKGLRQHTEPRFLAELANTGNIYVIVEVDRSGKPSQSPSSSLSKSSSDDSERSNHYFTGIALLSRPQLNTVYKNIAIASTSINHGTIRVAVIWQTTSLEGPRFELYVYDIPEAMYYEPCRSYDSDIPEMVSATAGALDESAIPRRHRLVQGKRVTSLSQHMGGTHPSSPLYQLTPPQDIAMGGLQLPHTVENQDTYPRNVQYQKCFVWGPATSETDCTKISFQIFDFSFADPQRLHSLIEHGIGSWQRRNESPHTIALKALHCACRLHDDGFRILLPDITAIKPSKSATIKRGNTGESPSTSPQPKNLTKTRTLKDSLALIASPSRFSWSRISKQSASAQNDNNTDSIPPNDSAARQAALERQQEWLRGRIKGMKRMGLSNFAIAEVWHNSAWTQYGQLRKPEGWQDLGDG